MLTVFFQHKLPKETQRWLKTHGVLCHHCQEYLVLPGVLLDELAQVLDQGWLAGDKAQVKENVRNGASL